MHLPAMIMMMVMLAQHEDDYSRVLKRLKSIRGQLALRELQSLLTMGSGFSLIEKFDKTPNI